jgi:mannose-1-phosphate guanylyltransferase
LSADAGLERWVAILAGGIGSRFWPASTPRRPKQFLPLATERPLICDTLDRARALAPISRVLIVAGSPLEPHLKKYLPELPADQLLLEPQAKGTAPALAWAAREIIARSEHPERTVMVSLHSDHVVRPLEGFLSSLGRAVDAAAQFDRLLTVGIAPTRPETGYGYIEVGDSLGTGVFEVRRFVEKPDLRTAEGYIARGGVVWNSGMFVWRPQVLLGELASHTPELAAELRRLDTGDLAGFFANTPTLTIDHGLMERSPNIAVVAAEFEWDDVGAWAALRRVRELDDQGNLIVGDAYALDCDDCLLWAEDGPVAVFGLSDIVVVRASGITLVSSRDHASDLKRLLAILPDDLREGID